ncbi:MAG: hypothetical protein ACT4PP_12100, partial [Sporichthyaceae bacterium]
RFTWEDLTDPPLGVLALVDAVRGQAGRRRPEIKVVPGVARHDGWSAPGVATLIPSRRESA